MDDHGCSTTQGVLQMLSNFYVSFLITVTFIPVHDLHDLHTVESENSWSENEYHG